MSLMAPAVAGAAGTIGPINYHAALRRSWADISEFSGQLELAWPF